VCYDLHKDKAKLNSETSVILDILFYHV